eukprot:366433-Chlamydomonas_euryale.AAC.28
MWLAQRWGAHHPTPQDSRRRACGGACCLCTLKSASCACLYMILGRLARGGIASALIYRPLARQQHYASRRFSKSANRDVCRTHQAYINN